MSDSSAPIVLANFLEALTSYQYDTALGLSTPGLLIIEGGAILTRDQIFAFFAEAERSGQTRQIKVEIIRSENLERGALILYRHYAQLSQNGMRTIRKEFIESAFLTLEDGSWKLSLLHSTKVYEGA